MASRIRLAIPMRLSHELHMCEECGGLNCHVQFLLQEKGCTWKEEFSVASWWSIFNSLQAPIKLVPLSEQRSFAGPQIEKNLLNAFMNLDVEIDSTSSMCTDLVDIHVKSTAHLLLSALPPLVQRVITIHGPKTSRPMLVKGGIGVSLLAGKSAIL